MKNKYLKYVGDYLAYDIVLFVLKNNRYITASAIEDALRGTKVSLRTTITPTEHCGMYNFYPQGFIPKLIDSLVYSGLLYENKLKGTYGVFYSVHISNLGSKYLEENQISDESPSKLKKKIDLLSDAEAEKLWRYKSDPKNTSHNILSLNLLRNHGFACVCFDEIVEYFKNAPAETIEYLRMLEDTDEDAIFVKTLKKIRSSIKKKDSSKQDAIVKPIKQTEEKPAKKEYEVESYKTAGSYGHKETRYRIVEPETRKVLDDAQGYGYKSEINAVRAWVFKNRSPEKKEKDEADKKAVKKWCSENKSIVRTLDRFAFEIAKGSWGPDDNFDANFVENFMKEEGIDLPFSAKTLLKYW